MENNLNQDLENIKAEQSKAAVKQDAKGLWESLKIFLIELLDFRHDTDREATVAAIKADIPFKGATGNGIPVARKIELNLKPLTAPIEIRVYGTPSERIASILAFV